MMMMMTTTTTTTTMMMMMMVMIIIIERYKSRFFTITLLHREPSPTCTLKWPEHNHVQTTRNTSSAYHVQHVILRAKRHAGTAQQLSLTKFKSHLFEFILLSEPFTLLLRP